MMAVVMVTNMEGWLWSYYLRRSRGMACGFVGDIGSINNLHKDWWKFKRV
jgi:hypothetical protein